MSDPPPLELENDEEGPAGGREVSTAESRGTLSGKRRGKGKRGGRRMRLFRSLRRSYSNWSRARAKLQFERMMAAQLYVDTKSEDQERAKMAREDQLSWVAFSLRERNRKRMNVEHEKETEANELQRQREQARLVEQQEDGITFHMAAIKSYKRWKPSDEKHSELVGHTAEVTGCDVSADGKFIVSCSADTTVILWSALTAKIVMRFEGHETRVNDCALVPNFEINCKVPQILSCATDGGVRLWATNTASSVHHFQLHDESIYCCRIAAGGRRFFTCSEDKTIRVWTFPEGIQLFVYRAHTTGVTSMCISPSAKLIASAGNYGDRLIRLWDGCMPRFSAPVHYGQKVFWSADGLISRILLSSTLKRDFWFTAQEILGGMCPHPVDVWRGERLGEADSDDEDNRTASTARGTARTEPNEGEDESSEDTGIDSEASSDLANLEGASLTAIGVNQAGQEFETVQYIPGGRVDFAVDSLDEFDQLFIAVVPTELEYEIYTESSGVRVGSFDTDVRYDRTVRLTCDGKALEMKTEEPLRSFRCTWQAPNAGCDSISVHCSVRLLPEERWVTLAVTLKEGQPEVKGAQHSTSIGMDSVLVATAEDLLIYTFDACGRHVKFLDAMRDGDDELALAQLQPDVLLYFGKRKIVGASAVLRVLKERVGLDHRCVWQHPFVFKPGQTRTLMITEGFRPSLNAAAGVKHTSRRTPIGGGNGGESTSENGGDLTSESRSRFSLSNLVYRTRQSNLIVEELARREADRIIKLRRKGLQCAEEIRTYGIPPSVLDKLHPARSPSPAAAEGSAAGKDELAMDDLLGPDGFGPDIDVMRMAYPEYYPTAPEELQRGLSTDRYAEAAKLLRDVFPLLRHALLQERPRSGHTNPSKAADAQTLSPATKLRTKIRHQLARIQKLRSGIYREHLRMESVAKRYNAEVSALESKLRAAQQALWRKRTRQLKRAQRPSVWSKVALALKRRADLKAQHRALREMLVPHIRAYMDAKARNEHYEGITDIKRKHVRQQLAQIENRRQTLVEIDLTVRLEARVSGGEEKEDVETSVALCGSSQPSSLLKCFRMQADLPYSHQGTINDLTFNHTETMLASCGAEGLVKIWDVGRGSLLKTLGRADGALWSNRFTQDDAHIITAGANCTIRIWSMVSNDLTLELRGHADVVYRCLPLRNGAFLVSCSHDKTVVTWCTVPQRPDPPAAPTITGIGMTSVTVSWQPPAAYGEAITAFHLQYRSGRQTPWQPAHHAAPFTSRKVLEGLTPATPYQVRVCAENRMGQGEWSEPCRQFVTLPAPPEKIARPLVVEAFQQSVLLAWFVPNINVYGAATELFKVGVSGGGSSFGGDSQREVSLSSCRQQGRNLADRLGTVSPHAGKLGDLSWQKTQQLATELTESGKLLMAAEIDGLRPGEAYTFNVTARSKIGDGPVSEPSYAVRTQYARPDTPHAPYLVASGLRSLTLAWYPPNSNGAAITGYRLHICHTGEYTSLGKAQTSFEITDLLPGTSYKFAIAARNSAGWSDLSPESADTTTTSSTPFAAPAPTAEALSCSEMRLRIVVPFANGAKVTSMLVQAKIVLPMRASVWGQDREFPVARLRKIQPYPFQSQQQQQQQFSPGPMVTNLRRAASRKKAPGAQTEEAEMKELPQRPRPVGGISFEHHASSATPKQYPPPSEWLMDVHFTDLLPDTPYIFRCAARNQNGFGPFSEPSEKIKTRRPGPPSAPAAPVVDEVLPTTLLLTWKAPPNGGAIVTGYMIEYVVITSGAIAQCKVQDILYHRLQGLKPGQLYKFRVAAENRIGVGPPGPWTHPIQTPEI